MKQNWQIKKLGEAGKIFSGNSINDKEKKSYMDLSKKGLFYVATKDISSTSNIDYENGVLIPDSLLPKFKIAHQYSVLICAEGGSAGKKLAFNSEHDICFVNKLFAFEASNEVLPKFVFYYYQSTDFEKAFKDRLTGLIGGVSLQKFKEIPCPLPPLEEQKRIVAVLDKKFAQIETLKTAAEMNLQNTKQLFQEEKEKAFSNTSWEKKRLEDICDKIVDGTHNSPTNTRTGDYQYITAKNIKPTGIDLSDITYVTKEIHQSIYSRCNPEKGDVLLIKDGATTGIAVVNELEYEFSLLSSVALLKPNKNILNSYCLAYLLNSDQTYKQFRAKMEGAAITRLTLVKIKNFEIPLPPLEEQKRIVAHLDSLSENVHQLEEIYTKQLADYDELKQSLLQKAFEGEL